MGETLQSEKMRQDILRELKGHKVKSLLDVGCYKGAMTNLMSGVVNYVEGCDICKPVIEVAKERYPDISFFQCDFEKDIAPKTFDAVTMFHVIEHIFDTHALLRNLSKCIKKDGLLIVATPNYASYQMLYCVLKADLSDFYRGEGWQHIRLFSYFSLPKVLAEWGFRTEKIYSYANFPFIPKWYRGIMTVIARKN